ncbi:NYN domain-containing protein [Selenomonas ruminantium]|uniref:NYN domain-containing protein n=1 Tax=Selenomonas ruminantium TaxID=971 RepID=UPI0003FE9A74|nr:NYN domain-containing protein [Selenomonas ruminantium]
MIRTAILVDGGFYRKRAKHQWGVKTSEERASELSAYCMAHIKKKDGKQERQLYRIFYYDCAPSKRSVYHPLTRENIDLDKSDTYTWTLAFLEEMKRRRKFAIRLGVLAEKPNYNLRPSVTKDLLNNKRTLKSLTERDFEFHAQQKGVDMRIGIDIASLVYKHQVDQIILIAGDSDFVPAAKLARREGIDFILDPMGADIKADLFEHIDGLETPWKHNSANRSQSQFEK